MIISNILKMTRLIVLTYVFAMAGANSATAQKLLVVGDSISAAYGMSLDQGWVALLTRQLANQYPSLRVVNASVSGETTSGALGRLPKLLIDTKPDLVLIELGGNDGLRGYPIGLLRKNLQQLVTLSQSAGAQVILTQMEIPPNYGARYTQAFHDSFVLTAKQFSATLAPFILEGVATHQDLMQADGIHPTATAQKQLLDNLLPTLLAVLSTP